MLDLIAKVFGKESPSAVIAKERLRLVLVHDRASVQPQVLERLKDDLIRVISEYLEIDTAAMDVRLDQQAHQAALVANIPVRRVKRVGAAGVR